MDLNLLQNGALYILMTAIITKIQSMERQAITMDYILMQQAESLHQTEVHQIQHSLILELRYLFL